MVQSRSLYLIICSLFILSGIAALIYQVVWFKQLSYFIGNTTYSQSVVLATYMGGLAVGAWFWGKKSDKIKNSLYLFAFLEITLALYCFFYSPIFSFVEEQFSSIVIRNQWESDGSSVLLLKFLVSGATIFFPTFLMGGTLPVLVKFLSLKVDQVGKNVSILYFINSFGAVLGTLLAGFYLIQAFGLTKTTYFAAIVELLVGLTSLLLAKYSFTLLSNEKIPEKKEKTIKAEIITITKRQFALVISIAAFSGFCAMIYEVVWLRLLIPVLSSSTYSFTIILAAFITGITIGSYLTFKYNDKIKSPLLFVGYCQLFIVISIFITLPFYEYLPFQIWKAVNSSINEGSSYNYYLFIQFTYVFIVLVLPTIFMGMSLPVLSRFAVSDVRKSGNVIGNIFAVNTLGTVLGSLITGLILIPFIGIYKTIIFALLINLVLAISVFKQKGLMSNKLKLIIASAVVITSFIFFKNVNSQSWAYPIMLSQVARKINRSAPPETYSEFIAGIKKDDKILYYNEGIGGTIIVGKNKDQIYLSTNGKGDANSVWDLRTQVSLGQTPIILHPHADSVFVIGYGAGTTIGNVLTHPNVKYAEVAEISGEVIEASSHFNSINEQPLKRKNLKVIKDDGVSALRLSTHKYDVIISQPSNPWSAGVGNLFTREFFQDCKEKLRPGGYVAQWFSFYEMNDKSLKLILRTALDQFNYVSLWHIGTSDILLLCSETPFNFDLSKIEKNYNAVQDKLKKININTFSTFLSQQIISSTNDLKKYVGPGEINTEDHPLLELWAPEAYYYNSEPTKFIVLDERKRFDQSNNLLLKKYIKKKGGLTSEEILQTGLFQSLGGCKELAYYMANLNPEIYLAWSKKAELAGDNVKAMEFLELASKRGKVTAVDLHKQRAQLFGKNGDFSQAIKEINAAIAENPENAEAHYQKGTFHLSLKEYDKAILALEKAIKLDPYMIDAYNNLAIIKGQQKDYQGVVNILDKAIVISDKNPKVYFNRAYAKGFLSDFIGAIEDFTMTIKLEPDNGQAYVLRGRAYNAIGKKEEACADFVKAKTMGTPGAAESIDQLCK